MPVTVPKCAFSRSQQTTTSPASRGFVSEASGHLYNQSIYETECPKAAVGNYDFVSISIVCNTSDLSELNKALAPNVKVTCPDGNFDLPQTGNGTEKDYIKRVSDSPNKVVPEKKQDKAR